jgi:hypothetical protein
MLIFSSASTMKAAITIITTTPVTANTRERVVTLSSSSSSAFFPFLIVTCRKWGTAQRKAKDVAALATTMMSIRRPCDSTHPSGAYSRRMKYSTAAQARMPINHKPYAFIRCLVLLLLIISPPDCYCLAPLRPCGWLLLYMTIDN